MYKKILVPLDGSPLAEMVLPYAEALAKSEGAEIVLLRVAVTPDENLFHNNPALGKNIISEIEKESEDYVEAEVAELQQEGFNVSGVTRDGSVSEMILEAAEETHADAIAMATHGRIGIQRWLHGSIADEVVHAAHIPVILIHPN